MQTLLNVTKLLIGNSVLAFILIPGFLVLNIYRAFTRQFPQSWTSAGFLKSQYSFFFLQFIFLFLSILLLRYTLIRWKAADPVFKKRLFVATAAIVALLVFLLGFVSLFVFGR